MIASIHIQTDTSLVRILDTINEKLLHIETNSESTSWVKWLTLLASIVIPILVGFGVFALNKRKEYTFKKSEVCGMIYQCIFELKYAIVKGTAAALYTNFNKRVLELIDDPEFMFVNDYYNDENFDPEVYNTGFKDSIKDLTKYHDEIMKLKKELYKYIGQYRFFLTKNKRKQFEQHSDKLTKMRILYYDFSTENSVDSLERKLNEHLNKYNRDIALKYKADSKKIEDFIAEN